MTTAGVALPAEPAAASLVESGHIIWGAPDSAGKTTTTWAGTNDQTSPDGFWLEILGRWTDIRYTVIGASGSSAGKGLKVRGGLGTIIEGTLPLDVREINLGWGLRGGSGEGNRGRGTSRSLTLGEDGGLGGYGYGTNYEGGGGGGSSYIAVNPKSLDEELTFYAVAGGGGGASGGYELDSCHGAAGGHSGYQGGHSPAVTVFAGGAGIQTLCRMALGGAAGGPSTTYKPDGLRDDHAPGSGGGGGGLTAGERGAVVPGFAAISATGSAGGGAGGGGGGSSGVRGDDSATIRLADEKYRGDGRVILDYYVAHKIDLTASLSGEHPLEAGYTQHLDLTLGAPSNAPAAELNLDGIVTATVNGEPLVSSVSGLLITGTIAKGIDVVLPSSSGQPHEICLSYAPASKKLLRASHCFPISISDTSLTTALKIPTEGGFFIDPFVAECVAVCTLIPAMIQGPWLHPRVGLVSGIDLGGEAPLEPTNISLHWKDLTSATSGKQIITGAELATKPGLVMIGQTPERLPTIEGAWPYTYVDFRPDGQPAKVGHAYQITAHWADAGLFKFKTSPMVTVKIVPSASQLTAQIANNDVRIGEPIALTASALGTPGNTLAVCCSFFGQFDGNRPISGTFTATLTRASEPGTVIATLTDTGTSSTFNSWPRLPAGNYNVAVEFTSEKAEWSNTTSYLSLTVTKASTQVSVAVDPSSAQYGSPRKLTAQVTAPAAAITDAPTGTVAFVLEKPGGNVSLGSGTLLANGSAVLTVDAALSALIPPGSHDVVATYSGDASYLGSDSRQTMTTTPEPPVITSDDATSFTAGVNGSFEITTTGVPNATLSVVGALPAGITLTDHGDGTGELSGATNDYGIHSVQIVATNDSDTSTDAVQAFTLTVTIPAVPLPTEGPPSSTGTLTGVPATSIAGQKFTVTGTGFAPLAPVTFGLYSERYTLGKATADALGVVTATLTIPFGPLGGHTVTAAGMDPDLTPQFLTADTTIVIPPGLLASTGSLVIPLLLLMSILLGLGVVIAGWRRPVSP